MTRFIAAMLCAIIGLGALSAFAHGPEDDTEIISAEGVRAIQAAMPEFERAGLDLSKYRVEVVRFDEEITVFFIDKDVSHEEVLQTRGSLGQRPMFGVSLTRDKFEVIRAHFQR